MTTYKSYYNIISENNFSDRIPTNDTIAWLKYPDYQFVYNKLWIAQSQDLPCGPMNVYPDKYPIIFKPIINLIGMSRGFKIINNIEEYNLNLKDTHEQDAE